MDFPLKIESLSTGYTSGGKAHPISNHISAHLPQSSLTALVGVNGAGKSTLLRTLSGLQPALSGEIFIEGKNLSDYTSQELAQTLSVVLTQRVEVEYLSAREVVEMGRMPYTSLTGRLSAEDKEKVESAMRLTNTLRLANKSIDQLSDGERGRVMIAKALAQDARIMLLDEPTAFLDFPSKVEMLRLLTTLAHERGLSILLSIHDLELALQFADHLWLMSEEGITQGTPQTLAQSGELSRHFSVPGITLDPDTLRFSILP
jgi:iron complex transport system ATP-binding protein